MPRKGISRSGARRPGEGKRALLNRISRIEGQVGALKRSLQDGNRREDLLIQIAAVRGAMTKVAAKILEDHLMECANSCIESNGRKGDVQARVAKALGTVLKQA